MRKSFQLTALSGAFALIAMGSVQAADVNGDNFDWTGWTVSGGTIDGSTAAMCDAAQGFTCKTVASGAGFLQMTVSNIADAGTGTSYVMTIVTDQNAGTNAAVGPGSVGLGFYDTSLIRMDLTLGAAQNSVNSQSGIVGHQEIADTGGGFTSKTDIVTGWAETVNTTANIQLTQTLKDGGVAGFAGDDFSSDFLYRSKLDANGTVTGFEMLVDQTANLGDVGLAASVNDAQSFALRQKTGSFVTGTGGPLDPNTNNAQAGVSWSAGDTVKAIWIGQEIELGTGAVNTGLLGSSFGYLAFETGTPATAGALATNLTKDSGFGFSGTESTSAWVWDPAFNITGPDPLNPNQTITLGLVDASGAPIIR